MCVSYYHPVCSILASTLISGGILARFPTRKVGFNQLTVFAIDSSLGR